MNNNNNNNDTNNTKISVLTWNVLASCYIFPESFSYNNKPYVYYVTKADWKDIGYKQVVTLNVEEDNIYDATAFMFRLRDDKSQLLDKITNILRLKDNNICENEDANASCANNQNNLTSEFRDITKSGEHLITLKDIMPGGDQPELVCFVMSGWVKLSKFQHAVMVGDDVLSLSKYDIFPWNSLEDTIGILKLYGTSHQYILAPKIELTLPNNTLIKPYQTLHIPHDTSVLLDDMRGFILYFSEVSLIFHSY